MANKTFRYAYPVVNEDEIVSINGAEPAHSNYYVVLWCGCDYVLDTFLVYAADEEDALEFVVAYLDKWNDERLLTKLESVSDLSEEEVDELYLYVDATLYGASQPYYVLRENLQIERLSSKEYKELTEN